MGSLNILCILVTLAALTGAYLHRLMDVLSQPSEAARNLDDINKIKNLSEQVKQLEQENLALRELAQSNGDLVIPRTWINFLEQANELKFKDLPRVIRGIGDEFLKSAASAWLMHFKEEGMLDRQYALTQMGFIPEIELIHQLALAESGPNTRRSLYDHERGCILIAHDFDSDNIFDSSSLSHSLCVALLEQNFPIEKKLSDDAWLARRMVLLGQANIIKQQYWTMMQRKFQLNGAEIQSPVSAEAKKNSHLDFMELAQFVRDIITAHTKWGRSFIESQPTDQRLSQLQLAFKKAHTSASLINAKEIAQTVQPTYDKVIMQTSLGAFAILSHALMGETIRTPLAVAQDWVADDLIFRENNVDQTLEVQWIIRFSASRSAQQFADHLKDLREQLKITVVNGVVTCLSSQKFSPNSANQ